MTEMIAKKEMGILLIMPRHYGLGAMIQMTVNALWLAKRLNKIPLIWWGENCFYRTNDGSNAYGKLFHSSSEFCVNDTSHPLVPSGSRIYPRCWETALKTTSIEALEKQIATDPSFMMIDWRREDRSIIENAELCVLNGYLANDLAWELAGESFENFSEKHFVSECVELFDQFFRPQAEIVERANLIWNQNFKVKSPVVGIHLRGSDKITEMALPSPNNFVNSALQIGRKIKASGYFLATDNEPGLKVFQRKIGRSNRLYAQSFQRTNGTSGLHFITKDGFQQAVDMIVDIECLSKCNAFLGFPGSQVFWWLMRVRDSRKLNFEVLRVVPTIFDLIACMIRLLRYKDMQVFITFLRYQKHAFRKKLLFLQWVGNQ